MVNGELMQKMVGVFYKIKELVIDMQDLGRKTRRTVLEENKI